MKGIKKKNKESENFVFKQFAFSYNSICYEIQTEPTYKSKIQYVIKKQSLKRRIANAIGLK